MGRLIVISNRVNPPEDTGAGSAGGLAMALAAALREYKGVWFGWSGNVTPSFTGHLSWRRVGGVSTALVDLEEQDVDEYYNGYANRTLWPLFHNRIDLTEYERAFGQGYDRVNTRFAQTLRPLIEPDDFLWVHDYHLIPLARELRKLGVTNRIGFFLHIPWPARQLFNTLPRGTRLLESLFDYDLIGFQAGEWLDAFEDCIHDAGGTVDIDGNAEGFGLATKLGVFPIGIDAAAFAKEATSPTALESFERMADSLRGRRTLLGVERMDYSKGLEERFRAFEQFLIDNPDQHGQVVLTQIATPSRDDVDAYQDIRARLDSLSGHINGAFGTVDWQPVRYINTPHRRDELAGIYRAAAIGLVTPLRDGMNLVAKEYVAAQDPDDPGVLVLSRFAGAAAQMTDALIVNPFSREEIADAIKRALAMPRTERIARWRKLMDGVLRDDVAAWRDDFVEALRDAQPQRPEVRPESGSVLRLMR